jgi:hypothetical protein
MSTVSTTNLKNASSGSNNIVLNTDGSIGGTCLTQTCRAWVNFNGTGVVAIRASYNVSSITDNGTGDYTVNFTNALADANYAVAATGGGLALDDSSTAKSTSAFRFNSYALSSTKTDYANLSISIFR